MVYHYVMVSKLFLQTMVVAQAQELHLRHQLRMLAVLYNHHSTLTVGIRDNSDPAPLTP